MRIFCTDDLINTFECSKFSLFDDKDVYYIINAIKTESINGYINADVFISKIIGAQYIYLQDIKWELAGAIDMFYNVFGLESDE